MQSGGRSEDIKSAQAGLAAAQAKLQALQNGADDAVRQAQQSAVDSDKVEILEMALARLPDDHLDRARVLATLCSELAYGSSLERREALAEEALAIAEAAGDDAIRVGPTTFLTRLRRPAPAEQDPTRPISPSQCRPWSKLKRSMPRPRTADRARK
jgi:hypothetical protein